MGSAKNCPICNSNEWIVGDHLVYSQIITAGAGVMVGGLTYPASSPRGSRHDRPDGSGRVVDKSTIESSSELQVRGATSPFYVPARVSTPEFVDWHMMLDQELSQLSRPDQGVFGSLGFVGLGAALDW